MSFLALVSVLFVSIAVEAAEGAPSRLNELETSIVGSTNSKLSIEQRVKQLELKVFAKSGKGSLSSRISALETFAGISKSDMMPPLPPLYDNGKGEIKSAPDHHQHQTSSSSKTAGNNASGKPLSHELEEAVKLHHDGKVVEAEESLRKILHDNPGNADAYFSLGAIAEARGDLQTALDFYTTAMQANPHDSESSQAVAELSRKITASKNQHFVNPLSPLPVQDPQSRVLQGRAWDLNSGANTMNQAPFNAGLRANNMQTPTLGVTQPPQRQLRSGTGSTIARTLARAALSTALSSAGLHCPMCQLLRGF